MSEIDFTPPQWLLKFYHLISITSITLNLLGIYLLMFQSSKMGNFKYCVLVYQVRNLICYHELQVPEQVQVLCTMLDLHLSFLAQLVPLHPLIAGYSMGILGSWFHMDLRWQMVFFSLNRFETQNLTILQAIGMFLGLKELEALIGSFAKKHQVIGRILLKKRVAPTWLEYSAYFGMVVTGIGIIIWPQFLVMSKADQFRFIETVYPEHLQNFKSLENFIIYEYSPAVQFTFVITLLGGGGYFVLFLIFIIDIFVLMAELKLRIAPSTYEKHKEAVQCLMVQFVMATLCLGPPCLFVVVVLFGFNHQQIIIEAILCWFSSHSSCNIICLMLVFPPYRRFFTKMFTRRKPRIGPAHSSVIF